MQISIHYAFVGKYYWMHAHFACYYAFVPDIKLK